MSVAVFKSWRKVIGYVVLPLALFVFAYGGGLQAAAKGLTVFFKSYVNAELKKLEAAGFINSQGQAEYVVGLSDVGMDQGGGDFLRALGGVVDARPTLFSGWYVVTLAKGADFPMQRLKDLPETEFVFQNRGLWICH